MKIRLNSGILFIALFAVVLSAFICFVKYVDFINKSIWKFYGPGGQLERTNKRTLNLPPYQRSSETNHLPHLPLDLPDLDPQDHRLPRSTGREAPIRLHHPAHPMLHGVIIEPPKVYAGDCDLPDLGAHEPEADDLPLGLGPKCPESGIRRRIRVARTAMSGRRSRERRQSGLPRAPRRSATRTARPSGPVEPSTDLKTHHTRQGSPAGPSCSRTGPCPAPNLDTIGPGRPVGFRGRWRSSGLAGRDQPRSRSTSGSSEAKSILWWQASRAAARSAPFQSRSSAASSA
jgi:hypothetical protein